MADQIRSTQFGVLVRFVSRNRVFRYPDEIDTSFTKHFGRDNDASPASKNEHAGNRTDTTAEEDVETGEGGCRYMVDWWSETDPENPQNWSSGWKAFIVGQICLMNFTFYIASSIYTPGEQSLMQEFGVSETVATLGLSLFSLGYGMGPMLWSPMSEIPRIGRRSIYFFTTLAFVLLQLPTGFAVNLPMFLSFRWLAGFAGSPALATGGATISDMYQPGQVAYGIALWGSFGICGPVFGPVLGGFAAQAEGWRMTIWIISWLATPTVLVMYFFMPETSASTILYQRARRLREATGATSLKSQSDIDAADYNLRDHLRILSRAFTLTFSEPIVFLLDLYTALVYGVLFTWFESFPFVFGEIYHFSMGEQGLVFLGLFVATLITLPLFLLWLRLGVVPKITRVGFIPESLLPPTFLGSFALPICLIWYGWSSRESVHWIVPIIGSSLFTISIITLFFPVLHYLGMAYPQNAASIYAGNGLFRATFGAIFPLFARQLFRRLGVGGGNSLLAGISICFMPVTYTFYTYGWKLRKLSRNARRDG